MDMIPSRLYVDLIKAFKKNDQHGLDKTIRELIDIAEKRKQYKLAKELRGIYASPNKEQPPTFFKPSSFSPTDQVSKDLFEIRRSKVGKDKIILSKTNQSMLAEIVDGYKRKELLRQHGLSNDSRIILHGPPGTGKTLFAYVLANELNLPIYHVYLDTLVSSYLGETGKNLKIIFEEASKGECILFLDEFDAIAKHRDDNQELGELKRVVTVLLQNIDELKSDTILVAATNHDHLLDPAVWRRFDYSLHMDKLDQNSRKALIKMHTGEKKINLDLLSEISEGLSGAVIRQIINRSMRKMVLDKSATDLGKTLVEGVLIATAQKNEGLKGRSRDGVISAIKYLRSIDEKRYTYEELEKMTGIASSTLHYLNK